jgi:hypothetical protein
MIRPVANAGTGTLRSGMTSVHMRSGNADHELKQSAGLFGE